MREDYMGAMNEREPIMSETSQELEDLHDEVLASLDYEEKLKEPIEG